MSCGVGRRSGSDPTLLWLWCGPAAAAPIRPLAWEPPYALGTALKKKKKKKVPLSSQLLECERFFLLLCSSLSVNSGTPGGVGEGRLCLKEALAQAHHQVLAILGSQANPCLACLPAGGVHRHESSLTPTIGRAFGEGDSGKNPLPQGAHSPSGVTEAPPPRQAGSRSPALYIQRCPARNWG